MLTFCQVLFRMRTVKYLVEWCPTCQTQVGQNAVVDESGEDCNLFDALKDYRLTQRGTNPHRCACGGKLVAKTSK
jgi:hypothetical protein